MFLLEIGAKALNFTLKQMGKLEFEDKRNAKASEVIHRI